MDVEDLIASMHVGREECELKALQAHLSKTLNYNPEATTYQPVQGVHYIPPPPVSSLNSVASTSYGGSYHHYPTHPNLASNQARTSRPQCTPAHSYRGFQPVQAVVEETEGREQAMDTDMDDEVTDGGRPARGHGNNGFAHDHLRHSSSPNEHDEGDYAAFSSDAFAPMYANDMRSSNADAWVSFKAKQQARPGEGGAQQTDASCSLSTSPSRTLNDQRPRPTSDMEWAVRHIAVNEGGQEAVGNWSGGRLRNTSAREHRRMNEDASTRRRQ